MPYEIRERDGKYCVCKEGGAEKKCYNERGDAEDYMKALYAAEDDMDDDDKGVTESSLGDGDPDAITIETPDEETKEEHYHKLDEVADSWLKHTTKTFLQRVADRFLPENTAFKVKGNHFLITWSNNFIDRDGEIFTAKAINAYINRVDMGMTPPPELWVWHSGAKTRIGQAEVVAFDGHFTIASGQFDTTPQAQNAKAYYAKHQRSTGVSHGFTFPASAFDGKHYHQFSTFEISLLPKAVAANPFTNLEQVKEGIKMALTDEKRKYLREVFGDEADRVLNTLEESGKALEDMQAAYKDFTDPDAVSSTAVSEKAVDAATSDLKALIPDLLEGQAEVFITQAETLKALKAQRDEIAGLRKMASDALAEAKQATENMIALKADLPRRPSTDAETVVEKSGLTDAMKNSMKQFDPVASKILGVPYVKLD